MTSLRLKSLSYDGLRKKLKTIYSSKDAVVATRRRGISKEPGILHQITIISHLTRYLIIPYATTKLKF